MTDLYKPVLIESAEQAEALLIGTVAQHPGMVVVAVRSGVSVDGKHLWYGTDDKRYDAPSLVGWTALVSIEAEKETRDHPGIMYPTLPPRYPQQSRLVTPWEDA